MGYGDSVTIRDNDTGIPARVDNQRRLHVSGDFSISNLPQVIIYSGDIQIGAVELKDATSVNRVIIFDTGSLKVSGDRLLSGYGDYGAVSVLSSATKIISGRGDLKGTLITPLGTIYIGLDAGVTSTNGEIMYSGDVYKDCGEGMYIGDVYGITSSGSVDTRYQRRW